MTNLDSILKNRHYFPNKSLSSQSYSFSSGHVWMWELDHKEGWVPKNWCFWTMVLEKTLERPLDCKEIKPINPKGNQPWIFIRTVAEAEAPILWPADAKSWLIGKDSDDGRTEGETEKGKQRIRWLDSITESMDMNLSKLWEIADRRAWHAAVMSQRVGHNLVTEQQFSGCHLSPGLPLLSLEQSLIMCWSCGSCWFALWDSQWIPHYLVLL